MPSNVKLLRVFVDDGVLTSRQRERLVVGQQIHPAARLLWPTILPQVNECSPLIESHCDISTGVETVRASLSEMRLKPTP